MALEPGRLQLSRRHAPGHDDLEGPFAEAQARRIGVLGRLFEQAIKAVTAPVQLLLQGDHLRVDGFCVFSSLVEGCVCWKRMGA